MEAYLCHPWATFLLPLFTAIGPGELCLELRSSHQKGDCHTHLLTMPDEDTWCTSLSWSLTSQTAILDPLFLVTRGPFWKTNSTLLKREEEFRGHCHWNDHISNTDLRCSQSWCHLKKDRHPITWFGLDNIQGPSRSPDAVITGLPWHARPLVITVELVLLTHLTLFLSIP